MCSFAQHLSKADIQYDRTIIRNALTNKTEKQILVDTVIPDKQTAIAVAESILFRVYGKDQILSEKPYSVCFVDGYWLLGGTLKEAPGEIVVGGTFFIILSAKDGRVIKLTHGK
jgi:hypothetical protein